MKTHGAPSLIVLLGLAAGAPADVVEFNNRDGAFPWGLYVTSGGGTAGRPFLDITRDSSQSGTTPLPNSFVNQYRPFITSGDWSESRLAGSPIGWTLNVASATPVHVDHWFYNTYMDLVFTPPRIFAPGEPVGPAATFDPNYTVIGGTVRTQNQIRVPFDLVQSTDFYVGVRISLDGLAHYGWVRLRSLVPFQWAYETTPNTPIQIPQPCAADWDRDGVLNSADFFAFLTGFFASDADFNLDGHTDSQDFFEYLVAFFQGCP